jgi:hypothetical protein
MRALLTATAILLVAMPAVAQPRKLHVMNTVNEPRVAASASPNKVGATGWTFDVVKIKHQPGWSTIKRTPYGVFTSRDECEMARAKQVADLDDSNLRQFKPLPKEDSPPVANTSQSSEQPSSSSSDTVRGTGWNRAAPKPNVVDREVEFMNATVCRDAAIRQTAQQD